VTIPNRFLVMLAATGLACAQPAIESAGGKKGVNSGGAGGEGGNGGNSGGGAGKGSGGSGGFTVNFGDGGTSDAPTGNVNPIGEGMTCAGDLHEAKPVPVDLLLLLDISGSMEESAGTQSKWTAMHDALLTFLKDPMSAGLGVGMETFPPPSKKCAADGECGAGYCEEKGVCSVPAGVATQEVACNDNAIECTNGADCTKYGICAKSGLRCVGTCPGGDACSPRPKFCLIPNAGCMPAQYENPIVAIADLPGAVPALEMALNGIVPQGTTPTTPAVTGALTHLRGRATANPDRKQVLVLATDGLPTECAPNNSLFAANMALRNGNMGMPAIPTYVIGIFGTNQVARAQPALNDLATSGGTGMPFTLTTGNDLSQRFLTAIKAIRGATLGCEFTIPKSATGADLDFDKVNVRVTTPAGPEDLVYVGTAAMCDPMRGGWYYDTDPKMANPTRVLLCDSTCKKVKMSGTSVDLRVGCKTIIIK
jgi:hypothetical protein